MKTDVVALLVVTALVVTTVSGSPTTAASRSQAKDLKIVATLTSYQVIARRLASPGSDVTSIALARQDAHFVQGKPSYSVRIGRSDLLIGTGLDLELWLPAVVDKSRNRNVRSGAPGFVAAAFDLPMLQMPASTSRSGGDIHLFGNPHVHSDPLRAVMVADNIKDGLLRVDSGGAAEYEARFSAYKAAMHERLFGAELVALVGGDKLADLTMRHELDDYLADTELGGSPLSAHLGGWLHDAECLKGARIVPYHLNWIYFLDRFGIEPAAYVERRPGIPPSAAHVADLVDLIRREHIPVLWVTDYYDRRVPELIAERTGARLLYVPLYPDPNGVGPHDHFELFDLWIRELRTAVPACAETGAPMP